MKEGSIGDLEIGRADNCKFFSAEMRLRFWGCRNGMLV